MDFGKIALEQLTEVDFCLQPDTEFTLDVLQGRTKVANPKIYIGCAKWGRKEWVGMIYPEKTKEAKFLDEYVKHFNSIELNAVFYNMPKKEQIRTWKEKAAAVRDDFKFCPKFSRNISHIRRLKNAEEDTTRYLESIYEFGTYLGPSFLQLADNFGPNNFETLRAYLEHLPSDLQIFVEVRHPEWFGNEHVRREFFSMLKTVGRGAIITDASGRRDCVHMHLSTPEAFIRFVGNGLHPTDYKRIDDWAERISGWVNSGLESVYFFLHQHDEKDTPILGDYTVKKFNEVLGINLAAPSFIKSHNQLFT
ncbi:DUF72 domain-containing protein [Pedobacter sp. SYSU D00535]|uniref:DUF72 domain-containing protein n=1 Tax=Pedobacter sp. SYSU D00535 TaxID=2810308 RepID=UPI001A9603CA|nr:DUF72 domain-containing protein [Pedobacter sp. SYSU D00535]